MTTGSVRAFDGISEDEYKRRIRAWTLYDWANSAFVTTVMAAVLPVYYSQVAGSTLPSAAVATAIWSTGLSVSLFITALISPILGTISDLMRGKKRFLAIFVTMGVIGTGFMVLIESGDWLLASLLFIVARVGFTAANVFYDALLPHVARDEDQDTVSTRGYALGYLGGGLLLAVNIVMIQLLPGTWGPRLSFLSVAIWWALFSIPIFRRVPEPPAATIKMKMGLDVIGAGFSRLAETFRDMRNYRQLFRMLFAFLIYNDGIGTIIGVAAIYGAELGFGTIELILALLLVQFVGIPYSLVFGRLPNPKTKRRGFFLAFVIFNLVALPLAGILGTRLLPADVTGNPPPPFSARGEFVGQGTYLAQTAADPQGSWEADVVSAEALDRDESETYLSNTTSGDRLFFQFNGQNVEVIYSSGPDHASWGAEIDGQPVLQDSQPLVVESYNPTVRYELRQTIEVESAGEHTLSLINLGSSDPASGGSKVAFGELTVLPPVRQSNLGLIIGLILALEIVGLLFAALLGEMLFGGLAQTLDTKRSVLLALSVYAVIAIWGFILNSVIEFWFLAWMVAVVQGGSQGLSRSLYASMAPAAKSGEFFGLFGIMEKFSAILGPLLFAAAATTFGSSRPAVLSLVVFFIVGGYLLTRVNVDEGRNRARAEDAALAQAGEIGGSN